jgi:hypothetical protein
MGLDKIRISSPLQQITSLDFFFYSHVMESFCWYSLISTKPTHASTSLQVCLQKPKLTPYVHVNGQKPLVAQLQCISSTTKNLLRMWPLKSEFSRFTRSIEPLTNSPLNATMKCILTPLS